MRRSLNLAAAAITTVVLAACQPTTTPTPTTTDPSPTMAPPTPTYQCTPEAGGKESPCSQIDYEKMKAKDALYTEAEAVYREFFAENIRISRAGGVTEPSQIILNTTAGSVQKNVMEVFRDMARRGVRAKGQDPILTINRGHGLSREGSVVALEVCADASGWSFYDADGLVSHGRPAQERVYFGRDHEQLKMIYTEGKWVTSCLPDSE
ncbi:MAG: hypothetical protein QM804_11510 [Propionicimonas sp.]